MPDTTPKVLTDGLRAFCRGFGSANPVFISCRPDKDAQPSACFDNVAHGLIVDVLRTAPGTHPAESKFAVSGSSVEVWLLEEAEPRVAWTQGEEPCIVRLP